MTDKIKQSFIIHNYNPERIPNEVALNRVKQVISEGRMDYGPYCPATVYYDGVVIEAYLNKESDRFNVSYDPARDQTKAGQDFEGYVSHAFTITGPAANVNAIDMIIEALKEPTQERVAQFHDALEELARIAQHLEQEDKS